MKTHHLHPERNDFQPDFGGVVVTAKGDKLIFVANSTGTCDWEKDANVTCAGFNNAKCYSLPCCLDGIYLPYTEEN